MLTVLVAVAGASGTLGRATVEVAQEAGHEVRRIARRFGVDVMTGEGVSEALAGVDVVVECLKPPSLDPDVATDWFVTAAQRLGAAARAAGVERTVVVSIVGIDRMQDYGYYRAQLAHERTSLMHCPGTVIVRSTQFHDFVGNMLRPDGDGLAIIDVASQPVDTRVVAEVLLEQATTAGPEPLVQIAGPLVENTVDQARRLLVARGQTAVVRGVPASPSMMQGFMVPGPDVPARGPTYDQWLGRNTSPPPCAPLLDRDERTL